MEDDATPMLPSPNGGLSGNRNCSRAGIFSADQPEATIGRKHAVTVELDGGYIVGVVTRASEESRRMTASRKLAVIHGLRSSVATGMFLTRVGAGIAPFCAGPSLGDDLV